MLLAAVSVSAQSYNWAVGVRGAYGWGTLNAKHFINETNAYDISGSVAFGSNWGWDVAALYEWNLPVITDGLDFYYGAGPRVGASKVEEVNRFVIGVQGVVGIEYTFAAIPLNIFLDYRPGVDLSFGEGGGFGFGFSNVGLGIRIVF